MIYPQTTFPFELPDPSSKPPEGDSSEVGPINSKKKKIPAVFRGGGGSNENPTNNHETTKLNGKSF
jgi:hypothetical protein